MWRKRDPCHLFNESLLFSKDFQLPTELEVSVLQSKKHTSDEEAFSDE